MEIPGIRFETLSGGGLLFREPGTDPITDFGPVVRGSIEPLGDHYRVGILVNSEIAALGRRGDFIKVHEVVKTFEVESLDQAEKMLTVWFTKLRDTVVAREAKKYKEYIANRVKCSYCSDTAEYVGVGNDGDFYCYYDRGEAPGRVEHIS